MGLRFRNDLLYKHFKENLITELKKEADNWKSDVAKHVVNNELRKYCKVSDEIYEQQKNNIDHIIVDLKANRTALAESFGTGTLMSEKNPLFNEYFKSNNEQEWNPLRKSKMIVGRPKGSQYIDLKGKPRTSSGALAGIPLENKKIKLENKKYSVIKPISPSFAIEHANNYLKNRLNRAYKRAFNNIKNFSIYFEEY